MQYPVFRARRVRSSPRLQALLREIRLLEENLVQPYFVVPGKKISEPVSSLPGNYHLSPDVLVKEIGNVYDKGLSGIMLFGLPEKKDKNGAGAYDPDGAVPLAITAVKKEFPELIVMVDICLCAYTDHGHCGVLSEKHGKTCVDNDATNELLAKMACVYAEAGADVLAPSAMMDGQVYAIRSALDKAGFEDRLILSYSAKYASSFYGPFREAAHSSPKFFDRSSYQINPCNLEEALREIQLDIEEGADITMVKPATPYLDVIREAKNRFKFPICGYCVSGEYAMIKSAGKLGLLSEEKCVIELLTSIKRAGADFIITYWAKDVIGWL